MNNKRRNDAIAKALAPAQKLPAEKAIAYRASVINAVRGAQNGPLKADVEAALAVLQEAGIDPAPMLEGVQDACFASGRPVHHNPGNAF